MPLFSREKKYSLSIPELDDYAARIFQFLHTHQRLPTNQELFLELKIPSNHLEEVLHYFNNPSFKFSLKKIEKDQKLTLDQRSVLMLPFLRQDNINIKDLVINLKFSTSKARTVVNFCNTVFALPEKQLSKFFDLFSPNELELNAVRVVKSHMALAQKTTSGISVSSLARDCRLGVLATRTALQYYHDKRLKIPYPKDLSNERIKELDGEIRLYFSNLLKLSDITLDTILNHPNWNLPLPEAPELTMENVTTATEKFLQDYNQPKRDPLSGLVQLAGDALKNVFDTFVKPVVDKAMEDHIPNPTLRHAQELLCVLRPLRDETVELATTYETEVQTISYTDPIS